MLGLSASKASSLLERLREELALQNGLLAPLTPAELAWLNLESDSR